MTSSRRIRTVLVVVLTLVAALLAVGSAAPAGAADGQGLANGNISCPKTKRCPGLRMLWFDRNWNYLGQKSANGGGYSVWLDPGTYHLQFVDQRPSYDVAKFAPTDVTVVVRAGDLTKKNLRMRPGAAITGTARGGGKPLRGATIYAANKAEQSFSTVANKRGQFALGGLPQGKYCLFTYDKQKARVDKCTWVGMVRSGQVKNSRVTLRKKAGSLTVYLFTPDGRLRPRATVTVTSKQTGQWWTTTARNGTAKFTGLHPGAYRMAFEGAGVWFAKTGNVQRATVKQNRMAFGKFTLTQRGGWVTGTVVDGADPTFPMAGVKVTLWNAAGDQVSGATSNADGYFRLDGRLATQSGLTIALSPGDGPDSWMQGAEWCMFTTSSAAPFSVTTGRQTEVGDLALPRSTVPQQPQRCLD